MKYLITGGSGFIGSHLVKLLLQEKKNYVYNIDKLTYASNNNLNDLKNNHKYSFKKLDISNYTKIYKEIISFKPDIIFNLAAETHVDKSIINSNEFINTNILGTFYLLKASLNYFQNINNNKKNQFKFIQISTDEVYGSLIKNEKHFTEKSNYKPNSPYSASKASADHIVRAWNKTYKFPSIITHCSNNYGPYQNHEKFIPMIINNALKCKAITIYGSGKQLRDWIHVEDHVNALYLISKKGKIGETYNIGSNNIKQNINIAKKICKYLNKIIKKKNINYLNYITFINDRLGHDFKYAINTTKIYKKLNWKSKINFNEGLYRTVNWYIKNQKIKD